MFDKNCPSLEQQYKTNLLVLTNQKRRKSSHSQFLTTNSYPHKKIANWSKYSVFPTEPDDICYLIPQCFISGGFITDCIIMNSFTDTTNQQKKSVIFFSK